MRRGSRPSTAPACGACCSGSSRCRLKRSGRACCVRCAPAAVCSASHSPAARCTAAWLSPHACPAGHSWQSPMLALVCRPQVGAALLELYEGQAANLIRAAGQSAVRLVSLMAAAFPGFRDHCVYRCARCLRCYCLLLDTRMLHCPRNCSLFPPAAAAAAAVIAACRRRVLLLLVCRLKPLLLHRPSCPAPLLLPQRPPAVLLQAGPDLCRRRMGRLWRRRPGLLPRHWAADHVCR